MNIKQKLITGAMALALCGCQSLVYEDEGNCQTTYSLKFVYDMNLDWADAFPTLVNRVDLYAFNEEGVLVEKYLLDSPEVFTPGYRLDLDLEPGEYTLVAWAALQTGTTVEDGFDIPHMTRGVSTLADLTCTVKTNSNAEYPAFTDVRLPFLYHGSLKADLPDANDGLNYDYTMYLTKDTNHVRVMVQKIDGDVTSEEVNVRITAADEKMNWNNALMSDKQLTYLPYKIWDDEIIPGDTDETGKRNASGYIGFGADLMTGRLTDTMEGETWLYVDNVENEETIFRVPLIQYALMGKAYYEEAYGKTMTDAEYLDRQSEYALTFFVDKNLRLQYTVLDILSWRVVIHNYDISDDRN